MDQFEVLRRQGKEIDGTTITIHTNLHDLNEIKKAIKKYHKINVIANINGIEERFQYINPEIQWSEVWGNLYEMRAIAEENNNVSWKVVSRDTAVTMNQRLFLPTFYAQQDMPFQLSPIDGPDHLTYKAIPKGRRRKWEVEDNAPYSNQLFDKLISSLEKHDRHHGTKWQIEFPELV